MTNSPIANENEVLSTLTHILRGDLPDETPKISERLKAAEFLCKYYGTFDRKQSPESINKSVPVQEISAALEELMSRDRP